MTENKRFIPIDDGLDFMIRDIISGDDLIDADGVADVLNDYENETEQLKIKNSNLIFLIAGTQIKNDMLKEENEKLKSINKTLKEVIDDL